MKKLLNLRNSIITILCITIICLGIGFIVMSTELKKIKEEEEKFDVSFISIDKTSSIKSTEKEPFGNAEIIEENKEIKMNFVMNSTHDEIVYTAVIKNKGTMPARIVDVIESPNYNEKTIKNIIDPVTIKVTDVKGKVIKPNEEVEIKIVAYYNPSQQEITQKNIDYKIGLVTNSVY